MAGVRCMVVNWGREKWLHCGGEGTLSMERQKGDREGLRSCGIELAQEENLSGPRTGEREVLSVPVLFFQTAFGTQTLKFWKYMTFSGVELWQVLLGRRDMAPECIAWCSDLQGALGENSSLPGVLLEEGLLPPQRQKTLQVLAKGLSSAGWRSSTPEEGNGSMLCCIL